MHDLAMRLTQTCLSMGLIDESYAEWLTYSIEKRLTTLLTLFVLCLIGFFGFGWKLTLSFSVFFLLIRKYTNGYHAATYSQCLFLSILMETSVYKGYKQDKIEMRGDRAEMSDFPLYLNTVAGGLDCRDQTIGGFSFVVKIYAVPVVEIIG